MPKRGPEQPKPINLLYIVSDRLLAHGISENNFLIQVASGQSASEFVRAATALRNYRNFSVSAEIGREPVTFGFHRNEIKFPRFEKWFQRQGSEVESITLKFAETHIAWHSPRSVERETSEENAFRFAGENTLSISGTDFNESEFVCAFTTFRGDKSQLEQTLEFLAEADLPTGRLLPSVHRSLG